MKYTTNNLQTSLTIALADFLRSKGYDIYWHAAGTISPQTAGLSEAKAIISFVPAFPSKPTFILPANHENIQRLKGRNLGEEYVVVPALTLQVHGSPRRVRIRGLGHKDYEWTREVQIYGLAADKYQHRELADLLHHWLTSEEFKEIPVFDYDSDPSAPPALPPVHVLHSDVDWQELYQEVEAIRYYFRAFATVTYVE